MNIYMILVDLSKTHGVRLAALKSEVRGEELMEYHSMGKVK